MTYEISIGQIPEIDYTRLISEELWKSAERCRQQWQDNLDAGKGAVGDHGRPYVGTSEALNDVTVDPALPGSFSYLIGGDVIQLAIAEFGRAPGKAPPPTDAIAQWAREAQLVPHEGETFDDMVEAIRWAVAKRGLKAFAPGLLADQIITPTVQPAIEARIEREHQQTSR